MDCPFNRLYLLYQEPPIISQLSQAPFRFSIKNILIMTTYKLSCLLLLQGLSPLCRPWTARRSWRQPRWKYQNSCDLSLYLSIYLSLYLSMIYLSLSLSLSMFNPSLKLPEISFLVCVCVSQPGIVFIVRYVTIEEG